MGCSFHAVPDWLQLHKMADYLFSGFKLARAAGYVGALPTCPKHSPLGAEGCSLHLQLLPGGSSACVSTLGPNAGKAGGSRGFLPLEAVLDQ